jgi:hypothetical protein
MTIFDYQSPYFDWRYLYVAVSRLSNMENLTLFKYDEKYVKNIEKKYVFGMIARNIEEHKIADEKKGFNVKDEDYVDYAWVVSEIKRNFTSNLSGAILLIDNISIDRIDSNKPHTKSNCQLVNLIENKSKSNHDTIYKTENVDEVLDYYLRSF